MQPFWQKLSEEALQEIQPHLVGTETSKPEQIKDQLQDVLMLLLTQAWQQARTRECPIGEDAQDHLCSNHETNMI